MANPRVKTQKGVGQWAWTYRLLCSCSLQTG